MFLKRVELHGFKTFASRTSLDFAHGVTAVVGPNGSGKSNLTDAIRWALGESNLRHVRCRGADDLIFAGARGRGARPGGRAAMNMAEVQLTFDNTGGWLPVEYAEVRVGRRAYRGGDGEYLLNGARVRLRDITDLLGRAAVTAGGQLVIGQGLIDAILSMRPEERRVVVESLAGLRYYYSRRDEAEARLGAAEENLRQVDAMIAAAGPHVALLREQARAAGQYDAVERELRDVLILHHARAYADALARRGRCARALDATQAEARVGSEAVTLVEEQLTAAKESAKDLGRAAASVRGEIEGAHAEREAAERELAVCRARLDAAEERGAELRSSADLPRSRRDGAREAHDRLVDDAAAAGDELAGLRGRTPAVSSALESAASDLKSAENLIRKVTAHKREIEKREAAAAADLAAIEREHERARREADVLAEEVSAGARMVTTLEQQLDREQAERQAALARLAGCRGSAADAHRLAAESADRHSSAARACLVAEQDAAALRARMEGIRAWLSAINPGEDRGSPAMMLHAPLHLELALAAALGPVATARLTGPDLSPAQAAEMLDGGERCILFHGRAALSPLQQNAVEARLSTGATDQPELVGWGDRLARIDGSEEARAPLTRILSTVLIVADLEAAWRAHRLLAQEQNRAGSQVVLATLTGEVISAAGLLHRPATEGAAALGQARELRQIAGEYRVAEAVLATARGIADEAREQAERAALDAEHALQAVREAQQGCDTSTRRVESTEHAVSAARRDAQRSAHQLHKLGETADEREVRRRDAQAGLDRARREAAAVALEEAASAGQVACARAAERSGLTAQAQHAAALSLAAERAANASRRLQAARAQMQQLEDDARGRQEEIERIEAESSHLRQRTEAMNAGSARAVKRLDDLQAHLRPIERRLDETEAAIGNLEAHLAVLRAEAGAALSARASAELALQQADHDLQSTVTLIRNDLVIEPADLPAPGPDSAGLQSRIRTLRARLTALGPVNARAPEDLAIASERQQFLQAQAGDLRDGIARLRVLIADANTTVRERFAATVGELDTQFQIYLQRLFDGGRGELTALYGDTGLPGGLEIYAQPPGKRTRELALLSGGERALVGLALVFAMLAVRPVPFCVLDEAEAALDEANTLRVGEILRSLSTLTQFIVVTHNRGTMRFADALYGVTMAETGVSQVAGLRLDEIDAMHRQRAG